VRRLSSTESATLRSMHPRAPDPWAWAAPVVETEAVVKDSSATALMPANADLGPGRIILIASDDHPHVAERPSIYRDR
jgi:hypothetical protein